MIPFGKQQELLRDLKPLFCCFRIEGCGAALLHWPHPEILERHCEIQAGCFDGVVVAARSEWTQGAAPGAAQVDSATEKALVKLGGQLMVEGKAYEYDRKLADDIGPRLTGSDNYMKAAAWAVDEFKKMGLQNVHEENWEITAAWEPEVWATGEILTPHRQRLHLEADGWSVSTPEGGVKGKVYHLKELSPEGAKAEAADIKDAVVLVDEDSFPQRRVSGLERCWTRSR